jgi:uncharacterized protein (DUF1330 family)
MKKGYWIATYRKILDPQKLAKYAELAGPAINKAGGKFLVRGMPTISFEEGLNERTVVIEFGDVETAIITHNSADYKKALEALNGGVVRDLRIVEGV